MRLAMIETVIQDIASKAASSAGDDLHGFLMDLDHAIFASGLSEDAAVTQSEDDFSMLNVAVRLPETFSSLAEVKDALWQVLRFIAYCEFHAASIEFYSDAATFRFVTAIPEKGLRVTGTVIISGPTYDRIAGDGERGALPGGCRHGSHNKSLHLARARVAGTHSCYTVESCPGR